MSIVFLLALLLALAALYVLLTSVRLLEPAPLPPAAVARSRGLEDTTSWFKVRWRRVAVAAALGAAALGLFWCSCVTTMTFASGHGGFLPGCR